MKRKYERIREYVDLWGNKYIEFLIIIDRKYHYWRLYIGGNIYAATISKSSSHCI